MDYERAINRLARAYKRQTGLRLDKYDVIDLVERDTAMRDAIANINADADEDDEATGDKR